MKKKLLTTILLMIPISFGQAQSCTAYNDFFGIKIGCDVSELKDNDSFSFRYESSEGYRDYSINSYNDFYSGTLTTFEKPYNNKIAMVTLLKKVDENQDEILETLNQLETDWGLMNNKEKIIETLNIDPSTQNPILFEDVKASIPNPISKFLNKININLSLDPDSPTGQKYVLFITGYAKKH